MGKDTVARQPSTERTRVLKRSFGRQARGHVRALVALVGVGSPASVVAQTPAVPPPHEPLPAHEPSAVDPEAAPPGAGTKEEQEVLVRGTARSTRSGSRAVVTARDLQAVPLRTAEDALRLVPGMTLVQHGSEGKGYQFFLRGFDAVHGADFEVTLDGIPLNEWSNVHAQGYLDLAFIIPETIAKVEVEKGPFQVDQGAFAMAGSARYVLGVSPENRGLRASYVAGTTNRHRGVLTFSPKKGDGKDFVALEAVHDDGYGQNREIQRGSASGSWRLAQSKEAGTLSLFGSAYLADFQLPGTLRNEDVAAGRVGFYDAYDPASQGRSGRALLAVRHELRRARHDVLTIGYVGVRQLDFSENYTGFLIDDEHGDRRRQKQETFSFGVSLRDTLTLSEGVTLRFGGGASGDVFGQEQVHVGRDQEPLQTERRLDALQLLGSAFASLWLEPTPGLSLSVGGRIDLAELSVRDRVEPGASGGGTSAVVSPRFTGSWRLSDPFTLFASYGRGFRPPEARAFSSHEPDRTGLSEEVYQGGDPGTTTSDAGELGLFVRPSRYFSATATAFATFIAREQIFDHVSGLNLELNPTRRLGGELDLRSSPVAWLLLAADVTLVDARFTESGNPIPLAPWLSGGFRAVVTHDSGLVAGLRLFAFAPRALPHGATGAPYALLDATLGYHWSRFRLDLAVENLLGLELREGEYHYASHWDRNQASSQIPVIHTAAGPPLNARLGLTALF